MAIRPHGHGGNGAPSSNGNGNGNGNGASPPTPPPPRKKRNAFYKAKAVPDNIDAIVIGSGIGGLGLAALLSRAGKRVLVLEKHYRPGGCTHAFDEVGDNVFDSGETWIVQGRFFERFQAMKDWSGVFGGSSDGL